MNEELLYTSAKRGLKAGAHGFCTVEATGGMSPAVARLLESLSGYRHLAEPGQPGNPPVIRHVIASVAGVTAHVLSHIADAGVDYSGRSNKVAHHRLIAPPTLNLAGPAWTQRQPGFHRLDWEAEPRTLAAPTILPAGDSPIAICHTWERVAGDAGWAGVLAERVAKGVAEPIVCIVEPGTDSLALIAEAIALLPANQRWRATYSTFHTQLPPGVQCSWRFVIAGSKEATEALKRKDRYSLDLRTPLAGAPPANNWSEAARTGQTVNPVVPAAPAAQQTNSVYENGAPALEIEEPSPANHSLLAADCSRKPPAPPPARRSERLSQRKNKPDSKLYTYFYIAIAMCILLTSCLYATWVVIASRANQAAAKSQAASRTANAPQATLPLSSKPIATSPQPAEIVPDDSLHVSARATENPTVENPTAENPTAENPTAENPTAENPTAENPTAENPTVENPTAENPTAENPTAENPTVENPTVENPTVENPTVENPIQLNSRTYYHNTSQSTDSQSTFIFNGSVSIDLDDIDVCTNLKDAAVLDEAKIEQRSDGSVVLSAADKNKIDETRTDLVAIRIHGSSVTVRSLNPDAPSELAVRIELDDQSYATLACFTLGKYSSKWALSRESTLADVANSVTASTRLDITRISTVAIYTTRDSYTHAWKSRNIEVQLPNSSLSVAITKTGVCTLQYDGQKPKKNILGAFAKRSAEWDTWRERAGKLLDSSRIERATKDQVVITYPRLLTEVGDAFPSMTTASINSSLEIMRKQAAMPWPKAVGQPGTLEVMRGLLAFTDRSMLGLVNDELAFRKTAENYVGSPDWSKKESERIDTLINVKEDMIRNPIGIDTSRSYKSVRTGDMFDIVVASTNASMSATK